MGRINLAHLTGVQIRTTALFVVGLAGVIYETLVGASDRPTLLILFAAMMGLPLFLKADEKVQPGAALQGVPIRRDDTAGPPSGYRAFEVSTEPVLGSDGSAVRRVDSIGYQPGAAGRTHPAAADDRWEHDPREGRI